MLAPEELKKSPLFSDISYESYLAMYHCFQAVNRTFRPEEVICDFGTGCTSVGIVIAAVYHILSTLQMISLG